MAGLATIAEAMEEYRHGRSVIIVDDEGRENEGDITLPAQFVTPETINFMARYGRGLICIAMTGERLDELQVPLMVENNRSPFSSPFTFSVDAAHDTTTGISAADRAQTVKVLIDPHARPEDLVMPGHLFPLRAREGGVLARAGHTEAGVDLCRLAGLYPAAVLCEIMKPDGTMARLPDLKAFAHRHNLKLLSINHLIAYRLRKETLVQRVAEADLPTRWGNFHVVAYRSVIDREEHVAFVKGDIHTPEPVLVRVHSQCVTGDVFHSLRCDCGEQVEKALEYINHEGRGVLLYMRQEGRGIGLHNKIRAYALQDQGLDTVEANEALGFPADRRDYGVGMQILVELGLREIRLLTNNPSKRAGLEGYGLKVVERLPLTVRPNRYNLRYLQTKRIKLGHLIEFEEAENPPGGVLEW